MTSCAGAFRAAATAAAVLGGSVVRADGEDVLSKSRAAAHPAAPDSAVFFQSFDSDSPTYQLSEHAGYVGQNIATRAVEGSAFKDDNALVLESDAHRYGVYMGLPSNAATNELGDDFVLQYEVRLTKGLSCGGAYLKLLDANALPENGELTPDSPYIIMFGPDKCGDNDKVHFILRHQNPLSKEWEEKHFKSDTPLKIQSDKFSHLYTLVVRQDSTFTIKVDGTVVASGHLLQNMEPPINPPAEIDDPSDTKPSDWVDEAKIPDPEASKPEDWDEDAPAKIPDASASMPEGWLEDETYLIPDPSAEEPEDWDAEEDGEWEAPSVQNPKCASAPGCEEWKRPMIANPAYKGKWSAPLIDNPEYVGVWAPQRIENPHFFVDENPAEGLMASVGAVAVEVWIHQFGGVTFDNILVGTSEAEADALAASSFKVKAEMEKANSYELERQRRHEKNLVYLEQGGFIGTSQYYFYETLEVARAWPIAAAGSALAVVAGLIYLCCTQCCGEDDAFDHEEDDGDAPEASAATSGAAGKAAAAAEPAPAVASTVDDNDGDDADDDDDDDAPPLKTAEAKKED